MADFIVETNNAMEVKSELDKAIERALESVGVQAVSRAVSIITTEGYPKPAVDTGLLRNSITYAVAGKPPKKTSYHASRNSKYHSGGKGKHGSYAGTAPADKEGEHTLYIGTNVYYAPYVEMGTVKMPKRPFLKPAIEGYTAEYKAIFEKVLKGN